MSWVRFPSPAPNNHLIFQGLCVFGVRAFNWNRPRKLSKNRAHPSKGALRRFPWAGRWHDDEQSPSDHPVVELRPTLGSTATKTIDLSQNRHEVPTSAVHGRYS